ncbi:MAG: ATP-grasp domain-containing protein [Rhodospirillales bacterium]|nr:ATP-grasp domain-containing protein [Rhodospirillales bacterium]
MQKLLIANRGEIACRIMRSARSLGIATAAVYSEADASARHVAEADEALPIGPPAAKESYLVADKIIAAARESGADAIHPGYGFLAENPGFAQAVEDAGLVWVGPTAESIAAMGDKERARTIAREAGLPIVPGSARLTAEDPSSLDEAAEAVGFPLLVKASAGGGGIGMRQVDEPAKLADVVGATQTMAERAFGDGTVYLERLVQRPRHVEIQVFGHGDGRGFHLMERECSVQRRFQKIVEEAPSAAVDSGLRARMTDAALALVERERYRGAGTVEFILAPDGEFYFLEMNTRIQVEHPATEMITGLDLVGLQLRLAQGEDLSGLAAPAGGPDGHAIECRIYAENPDKNFLPSPGLLERFAPPPEGNGIRLDTGVTEGDRITPFYDPMIAKLVAHGSDRDSAIDKMLTALGDFHIEGIVTNIGFLRRVVDHGAFRAGNTHTGFVDEHRSDLMGA